MQVLCRVLGVSCAGYYQWWGRAQSLPAPWQAAAYAAFTRHARPYGTRRLRAELRAEGHGVGRHALRSWLCRHGLRALSTRLQRPRTTVTDPAAVVAETAAGPARAHRPRPGVGGSYPVGRHHLFAIGRRALVLPGHLARCLLTPGRRVAPGRPHAHRTRAAGLGTSPDAAPTRAGLDYSRRPGQPIHQRGLPCPH